MPCMRALRVSQAFARREAPMQPHRLPSWRAQHNRTVVVGASSACGARCIAAPIRVGGRAQLHIITARAHEHVELLAHERVAEKKDGASAGCDPFAEFTLRACPKRRPLAKGASEAASASTLTLLLMCDPVRAAQKRTLIWLVESRVSVCVDLPIGRVFERHGVEV